MEVGLFEWFEIIINFVFPQFINNLLKVIHSDKKEKCSKKLRATVLI
jgi:hypothetical protein